MIVVTVELWKWGRESDKTVLGTAKIWNDGSGTLTQGNYGYQVYGKKGHLIGGGLIHNFPRKRLLAWDLLYRVLSRLVGSRNPLEPLEQDDVVDLFPLGEEEFRLNTAA